MENAKSLRLKTRLTWFATVLVGVAIGAYLTTIVLAHGPVVSMETVLAVLCVAFLAYLAFSGQK